MFPFSPSFVKRWAASAALLLMFGASAHATLIDFEDVGTPRNVSPSTPYSAFGFTFTDVNSGAGILQNLLQGDATFSFDFQGEDGVPNGPFLNPITLTGPGAFDLTSFLAGRTYYAVAYPTIDLTVTGYFSNGTTEALTFAGLSNAKLETVNWTHLTSVVFTSSADAGIDNLLVAVDAPVTGTPEPGTLALLLAAGAAFTSIRRLAKLR